MRLPRKAILKKYAPRLSALSCKPDFYIFWLMGGALVAAIALLTLPANGKPSFALFVISLQIAAIPGTVLKELAEGHKMKSTGYLYLQTKRDARTCRAAEAVGLLVVESQAPLGGAVQAPGRLIKCRLTAHLATAAVCR
jgi:hypothetical protein